MAFIRHICFWLLARVKTLLRVKALFRVLVLSLFVYGQLAVSVHAHEHEHEDEPQHSVCAFCITPLSDEDQSPDDDDVPDEPVFLVPVDVVLVAPVVEQGLNPYASRRKSLTSKSIARYSHAVRAPPFQ